MMIQQIQKAYELTTEWQKLEPQDAKRRGVIVQNQSSNVDSVLISAGRPTTDFAALELVPNGDLYEDILPVQNEIYAKAVTGTPTLTLVIKY